MLLQTAVSVTVILPDCLSVCPFIKLFLEIQHQDSEVKNKTVTLKNQDHDNNAQDQDSENTVLRRLKKPRQCFKPLLATGICPRASPLLLHIHEPGAE